MNMAPISDPNTMMPAQAATQNTRREAMLRSYSGLAARRWRRTKATPGRDRDGEQADRERPVRPAPARS